MERRKAVTVAAAASLTMLAGAAGIALNSGIVGADDDGDVGKLSPIATSVPPLVVTVDDPAAASVTPAPVVRPSDGVPVAASSASGYQQDGDDEGRFEDDEEHEDEEHEDEEHEEYEGADDDD